MTTRIYIVEDEPLIADTIQLALEKEGYVVCGSSDNAEEALPEIEELLPDLVLLDINIEGEIDGIACAKYIQENFEIPFIFLTSLSDKDTLEKVTHTNPAGFLNKPFNETGLCSNIEIALNKHKRAFKRKTKKGNDTFFIKEKGRLIKINKSEVLFLEAFDNYAYIITTTNKHLVSYTLKDIHSKMEEPSFIRIHRSYVINIHKIDAISNGYVIMQSHKLSVGKSYKDDLMSHIATL
ncbi:MAG: response regulator [Flavobacteriaceae bacterium]|nr:response regulator [Flavobacteriaceae bacterium]